MNLPGRSGEVSTVMRAVALVAQARVAKRPCRREAFGAGARLPAAGPTCQDCPVRDPDSPLRDDEVERRFAEIIADLGEPDAGEVSPTIPSAINPPPAISVTPPRPALDVPVWRGAGEQTYDEILDEVEDSDHFEPPPPRPLPPQEDLHFWGSMIGLVTGPLLLLWLVLFDPNVAGWWLWLALGLTVGGFLLLVMRPDSEDDDGDYGNGAVV